MSGLSRRRLLGAGGLGILSGLVPMGAPCATPLGLPIGIQGSTVADELKNDFEKTVAALASMGYRQIETALTSEPEASAMLRTFQAYGLGWESAHLGMAQDLLVNLEAKLELAVRLGIKYAVCTVVGLRDPARLQISPAQDLAKFAYAFSKIVTLDDWAWTAETLNKAGEAARKAGIGLAYHNEPIDFRRFGTVVAYDELVKRTDPDLVSLELDCGNAAVAGVDPVAYIEKYGGRISLLHVKDVKRGHVPTATFTPETRFDFTEVGRGSIDWRLVFQAAKKTGIKRYYVEQGPPFERPPLEAARISYEYLCGLSI
jgi:sugar phosphate isomerase/epimerase